MKQYFEKQEKKILPIDRETLDKLKGKTVYGNYKEGHKVYWFMETIYPNKNSDELSIELSFKSVLDNDLDKLERDFEFVRMARDFPVLVRKENKKDEKIVLQKIKEELNEKR